MAKKKRTCVSEPSEPDARDPEHKIKDIVARMNVLYQRLMLSTAAVSGFACAAQRLCDLTTMGLHDEMLVAKIGRAKTLLADAGESVGNALEIAREIQTLKDEVRSLREEQKRNEERAEVTEPLTSCNAGRDGDCYDPRCPQNKDGEPAKSGRHCPLDKAEKEEDEA